MWNLKKTDSQKQDRLVNFRGGPGVGLGWKKWMKEVKGYKLPIRG